MNLKRSFESVLAKRLREPAPLLQILIGPRQVGKTTAAREIYDHWEGPKHFATADHPTPPGSEWIRWQWEKAKGLGPNSLLIIDEVQKVESWSEQIKTLFDSERGKGNLKVLLLGSSSLYLQKGMKESLAGRFELVETTHWSLVECQQFFELSLDEYLQLGGYPGSLSFKDDFERWQQYILHSVIEPVLSKDILGQNPVMNPALFRQTFELAVHYPSQTVSFQKLLGQLQEKGNASTIKHYLTLLEQAFLIKMIPKYSGSPIQIRSSSPKIIILNPALIQAYQPMQRLAQDPAWRGFVFENMMGAHLLRKKNWQIFYWRQGAAEVDFVIQTPDELIGLEIKSGRQKMSRGLKDFSAQYPKARCEVWGPNECLEFLIK